MPGKMCAALNQFFTRHHEDEEAKLQRKIWAFLDKKKNDLLFLRFYNCELFEQGPRGKSQMSSMPSSLIQPCWNSRLHFAIDGQVNAKR